MKNSKEKDAKWMEVDRRTLLRGAGAAGAMAAVSGLVPFGLARVAHAAATGKSFVIGLSSEANGVSTAVARADHLGRLIERSLLDYDRAGASFKVVPGTAAAMPEVRKKTLPPSLVQRIPDREVDAHEVDVGRIESGADRIAPDVVRHHLDEELRSA